MSTDQNSHSDSGGSESNTHQRVEDLLYQAPVGLMTIRLNGTVIAHNRMLCEWLGLPDAAQPGLIVGVNAFDWLTPDSRAEILALIESGLNGEGKLREHVIHGKKLSGEPGSSLLNVDLTTDPSGEHVLHIAMIDATNRITFEQEVVEAHAAADEANRRLTLMQEQLRHSALHDALTGLPNKTLLEEQLRRVLGSVTRSGQSCAVLFLDLDNFRQLNSGEGFPVGDSVIQEVARRIRAVCTGSELVSRYSGDEFVIVMSPVTPESVEGLCERLHDAVNLPMPELANGARVTTSIGAVIWQPVAGEGPPNSNLLFSAVDRAVYQAKLNGRNTTVVHEWSCESK